MPFPWKNPPKNPKNPRFSRDLVDQNPLREISALIIFLRPISDILHARAKSDPACCMTWWSSTPSSRSVDFSDVILLLIQVPCLSYGTLIRTPPPDSDGQDRQSLANPLALHGGENPRNQEKRVSGSKEPHRKGCSEPNIPMSIPRGTNAT